MAILSCCCKRINSINRRPTVERSGFRDPHPILRKFYGFHKFNPNMHIWYQAVREVQTYIHSLFLGNIRPYHFRDRLEDLAKDTSPGLYWRAKGYKTKSSVIEEQGHKLRVTCHKVKTGKLRDIKRFVTNVVVADAKTNLVTNETKARCVWVYPLEIVAMENMFYAAFADKLPEDWVPTPATCHDTWCGRNSGSADFKTYDSSVPQLVIRAAFDLLYWELNFATYNGGAIPKSRTSLERLWDFLVEYFIYTPHQINGEGDVRLKHHGIPSGSMFTNLIDTISSRLIITYLHRANDCDAAVRTYGDDIHFKNCTCLPSDLETRALEELNMVLTIVQPNEHGCLTYCKAECHLGTPFHDGQWFRNILHCTPYVHEAAECLQHMEPTLTQYNELAEVRRQVPPARAGRWYQRWRERLEEYWPKFFNRYSTL